MSAALIRSTLGMAGGSMWEYVGVYRPKGGSFRDGSDLLFQKGIGFGIRRRFSYDPVVEVDATDVRTWLGEGTLAWRETVGYERWYRDSHAKFGDAADQYPGPPIDVYSARMARISQVVGPAVVALSLAAFYLFSPGDPRVPVWGLVIAGTILATSLGIGWRMRR